MKVKTSTLSMLSKIVKDAINSKDVVLYAQDESFSEANLGAKYVLELGDNIYTLAGNGLVVFVTTRTLNNINYKIDDIVELVEENKEYYKSKLEVLLNLRKELEETDYCVGDWEHLIDSFISFFEEKVKNNLTLTNI